MSKRTFIWKANFMWSSGAIQRAWGKPACGQCLKFNDPQHPWVLVKAFVIMSVPKKCENKAIICCLYFRVNLLWSCVLWAGLINGCWRKLRHWLLKRKRWTCRRPAAHRGCCSKVMATISFLISQKAPKQINREISQHGLLLNRHSQVSPVTLQMRPVDLSKQKS